MAGTVAPQERLVWLTQSQEDTMATITSLFRSNGRSDTRSLAKYAGMASLAVPIARRLAADDELRRDLRTAADAARKALEDLIQQPTSALPRKLVGESDLRQQLDRAVDALQEARERVKRDATQPTSSNWAPWLIAAGVAGGLVALFVMPQTGPRMRSLASALWDLAGDWRQSPAV